MKSTRRKSRWPKFFKEHKTVAIRAGFIFGFVVIGTVLLLTTKAATFVSSLEPEQGTAATKACVVSGDNTASGGSYVRFSSTACSGGSLPAGVTLTDIDGGPTYFNSFSNTDPRFKTQNFFPLVADSEYDGSRYPALAALGINGVKPYNGPDSGVVAAAQANNLWIMSPGASVDNTLGNKVSGLQPFDEIDEKGNLCSGLEGDPNNPGPVNIYAICQSTGVSKTPGGSIETVPPSGVTQMQTAIKAYNSTRWTEAQYSVTFACSYYPYQSSWPDGWGHAMDVISYDWYPITDPYEYGCSDNHNAYAQYDAVQSARSHTGKTRPLWIFIETSKLFNDGRGSGILPSGNDIKAEVMAAIIGGARGIQYFNNDFSGGAPNAQHVLTDPGYAAQQAGISAVNSFINQNASVINAQFANNYETHTGALHTMTKYYNGHFYIFAGAATTNSQSAQFTLAGGQGTSATVLGENRSVSISGGKFTDTFADKDAWHVYQIN